MIGLAKRRERQASACPVAVTLPRLYTRRCEPLSGRNNRFRSRSR